MQAQYPQQQPRSGKPQHICFYSNKCKWSAAFLTELAKTPYKGEFSYICIDPSPTRPQLPSFLKKVPTIVIRGEPEPRTDWDVMNWLSQRKLSDGGGAMAGQAAPGELNVSDYISCEMDSIGQDLYSFVDSDGSVVGDGGSRITQTFAFLSDEGAGGGVPQTQGQPMGPTGHDPKRSKKEEMFDKQMEAYMKNRDSGMPQTINRL
jgi:hypothetical protein